MPFLSKDKKKKYDKQYYLKNKEKIKERSKKYHVENREKCLKQKRQYRINNKEKIAKQRKQYYKENAKERREYSKQYCLNNPKKAKESRKQYYLNNIEKMRENKKQYRLDNSEKLRKHRKQYCKNRYKVDLKYNLNCRMVRAIGYSLKGNKAGRHWEDLVDYTLDDLIKRLKRTIPKEYVWEDFLNSKLHIDHIVPKSVFNFTKSEHTDFKRCWALNNLRLLPAKENIIKGNKLTKPFQPALSI